MNARIIDWVVVVLCVCLQINNYTHKRLFIVVFENVSDCMMIASVNNYIHKWLFVVHSLLSCCVCGWWQRWRDVTATRPDRARERSCSAAEISDRYSSKTARRAETGRRQRSTASEAAGKASDAAQARNSSAVQVAGRIRRPQEVLQRRAKYGVFSHLAVENA